MQSLYRFAGPGLATSLLTTFVFMAAACGGSAPIPSPINGPLATPMPTAAPPTRSPTGPETAGEPAATKSVFLELLGAIPDTLETRRWVLIND